ncbi:MAG: hypothetical protein RIT81_43730 [Deltaproteobacteria bacterium]
MNRRTATLALALLAIACKEETKTPEAERDAGVQITALDAPDLGVRVPLLSSWRAVTTPPSDEEGAKTVAAARRLPEKKPFLAVPRLVLTVQETVMQEPEPVFRDTLQELKSIGTRTNVQVIRTALSSRPIAGGTIGDIEMVYTLLGPKQTAKTIVHRSIVALRTRSDESRAIVSATATYLQNDRELVGAEVQVMLDGFELYPPQKTTP